MLAVAHRAGNTVDGLRAALAAGVDLVELDVHLHRGALEVRHHKAVGRNLLYEDGSWVRRADFALVTLEEILAAAASDPRLMLDLKGIPTGLAAAVATRVREHMPDAAVTVCSRHWWMLEAFAPPVRTVLSAGNRPGLARLRHRLATRPADGVSLHLGLLTPEVVRSVRERSGFVLTWPVDTPRALARAREVGVDGVISKNLELLASL